MKAIKRFIAAGAASGAVILGSATIAAAQSVDFGPATSTVTGGTINVSVSVPSNVSGDGTLSVTYFGDFSWPGGSGTQAEIIQVFVEGTQIGGDLSTGNDCTADATSELVVPAATLEAAAADGTVDIAFVASSEVNVQCSSASSAAFNYPGTATFAVLGTLAYGSGSGSQKVADTGETTMMANRGTMIMSNTVDKQRRINRLRNGSGVTREALSIAGVPVLSDSPISIGLDKDRLNFAAGADWGNAMIWAEGRIAKLDDEISNDAHFGILHFGVDWKVNSNMLIGVSAQVDTFEQYDIGSATDFSGVGWMVGPVVTARVAPNLYFNGRLAYGHADNDAERIGGKDSFDSERALAEISLTGEMTQGAYSIFPTAELAYFREESDAYFSATYGPIAAAEVALGQARLGGRVERSFELAPGQSATGFVDVFAVYTNRYEGTLTSGSFAEEIDGWSGETEIGMNFATKGGATVAASVGAGGLFADAKTYSAMLSVTIPLK